MFLIKSFSCQADFLVGFWGVLTSRLCRSGTSGPVGCLCPLVPELMVLLNWHDYQIASATARVLVRIFCFGNTICWCSWCSNLVCRKFWRIRLCLEAEWKQISKYQIFSWTKNPEFYLVLTISTCWWTRVVIVCLCWVYIFLSDFIILNLSYYYITIY